MVAPFFWPWRERPYESEHVLFPAAATAVGSALPYPLAMWFY